MEYGHVAQAVSTRAPVRIVRMNYTRDYEGIAMGYNSLYDTIRVGFVDAAGRYIGEKTTVGRTQVDLINEPEVQLADRVAPTAHPEM